MNDVVFKAKPSCLYFELLSFISRIVFSLRSLCEYYNTAQEKMLETQPQQNPKYYPTKTKLTQTLPQQNPNNIFAINSFFRAVFVAEKAVAVKPDKNIAENTNKKKRQCNIFAVDVLVKIYGLTA